MTIHFVIPVAPGFLNRSAGLEISASVETGILIAANQQIFRRQRQTCHCLLAAISDQVDKPTKRLPDKSDRQKRQKQSRSLARLSANQLFSRGLQIAFELQDNRYLVSQDRYAARQVAAVIDSEIAAVDDGLRDYSHFGAALIAGKSDYLKGKDNCFGDALHRQISSQNPLFTLLFYFGAFEAHLREFFNLKKIRGP